MSPEKEGVFISHIAVEKPVALVMKKYLRLAFGDDFRVFVASDSTSIGGGTEWFNYIIENLRRSRVVLVLVSQESRRREWINFEAGFGGGADARVIPVAIKNLPPGQMAWPLLGFQGRTSDELGAVIEDVRNTTGMAPRSVDMSAYRKEMEEAEASLIYKSLKVEPFVTEGSHLRFHVENVGNVDLELLMLEVVLPFNVVGSISAWDAGVFVQGTLRNGQPYRSISCFSQRGTHSNVPPILRPVLTPSMGRILLPLAIPVVARVDSAMMGFPIFYQIHAINYITEEEQRKLSDLGWG